MLCPLFGGYTVLSPDDIVGSCQDEAIRLINGDERDGLSDLDKLFTFVSTSWCLCMGSRCERRDLEWGERERERERGTQE